MIAGQQTREECLLKKVTVTVICLMAGLAPAPAWAQAAAPQPVEFTPLLPAALVLFLPVGLLLLMSSALPDEHAPAAAINLLAAWGLAGLAYFAVGFAFHFGGVAQVSPSPDLRGLYWEWYPLDQSVQVEVARLWGVIALRGWFLAGEAATPGAMQLFLAHFSLVGAATMVPASVLLAKQRTGPALWTGLLIGAVIYPLAGNWLWGGGWLSHLGASLEMGHGLVDFGGASVVFLLGSALALVGLMLFRPAASAEEMELGGRSRGAPYDRSLEFGADFLETRPLPPAYLPLLSLLGGGLVLVGWFGLVSAVHAPTAVSIAPAQAAVNGLLAALAGAVAAASYSAFTTRVLDPLMAARGLVAGLVVAMAGAPFAPAWTFVNAGLVMGLLTPLLIYFFEHRFNLADSLGTLTTYGVSAILGLLLVAFFADGQAGQGWNNMGLSEYRGVAGQGVSGWLVAAGLASDLAGQFQAQVLGGGVILGWGLLAAFVLYQTVLAVSDPWSRSQLTLSDRSADYDRIDFTEVEPPIAAIELSDLSDDGPGSTRHFGVPRSS
jgi:Amt family ammonium transporter